MEQRIRSELHIFVLRVALIALISLVLSGCKKPMENPETRDPIYSALLSDKSAYKGAAEAEKKTIAELEAEIAKLGPRDQIKKPKIRELYTRKKNLEQMEQQALYFEIRAEQRKAHAREEYLKAFHADKPWPDPAEFEAYKRAKKLRQASKNWDDRVPKSDRYSKKSPVGAEAPKKAAH